MTTDDSAGYASSGSGYLLTNDAAEVTDRWSALSELFDEATFRHMDRLGCRPDGTAWTSGQVAGTWRSGWPTGSSRGAR